MNAISTTAKVLLFKALKQAGTYDHNVVLPFIEEELTGHEEMVLAGFLRWCHEGKQTFGRDTFDAVFERYCKEQHVDLGEGIVELPEYTFKAMAKLVTDLAGLILYEEECGTCGQKADTPNPKCADHEPFNPSDSDDAMRTLNSFVRQAREILKRYKTE